MYSNLLIILIPLIIGYSISFLFFKYISIVNYLLSIMIYIILFFMGINLAFLPNLTTNLFLISSYVVVTTLCILTMNVLALTILEKNFPWPKSRLTSSTVIASPSRWRIILNSLQLCTVVIIGFVLGLTHWSLLNLATKINESLLIFLLFLVGIQLRNSGMTLRQMVINRRGILVALVVAISALAGGALAAILLGWPLYIGMALASAYGWYSLSSILMTDAFGTIIGSTAFFNDLLRELLAMILIPTLMKHRRNTALGLCGATSMDFTLPVLQRSGGLEIVPIAIVHGLLLSILAPILIALFVGIANI